MRITGMITALVLSVSSLSVQADTLTFGIVPQQSAQKLARLWTTGDAVSE